MSLIPRWLLCLPGLPQTSGSSGFLLPRAFTIRLLASGIGAPLTAIFYCQNTLHRFFQRCILMCVRHQDWFAVIDLKRCVLSSLVSPSVQTVPTVVPWGMSRLSLLPYVFTKGMETAFAPLRKVGIHILNYLRRLASSSALSGFIVCAQGPGA